MNYSDRPAFRWGQKFLISIGTGAAAGWIGAGLFLAVIATPFALLLPGVALYVLLGIPFGALCGVVGGALIPALRRVNRWFSAVLFGFAWGLTGASEWWIYSTVGQDYTNNEGLLGAVLSTSAGLGVYMLVAGSVVGAFMIFRPAKPPRSTELTNALRSKPLD